MKKETIIEADTGTLPPPETEEPATTPESRWDITRRIEAKQKQAVVFGKMLKKLQIHLLTPDSGPQSQFTGPDRIQSYPKGMKPDRAPRPPKGIEADAVMIKIGSKDDDDSYYVGVHDGFTYSHPEEPDRTPAVVKFQGVEYRGYVGRPILQPTYEAMAPAEKQKLRRIGRSLNGSIIYGSPIGDEVTEYVGEEIPVFEAVKDSAGETVVDAAGVARSYEKESDRRLENVWETIDLIKSSLDSDMNPLAGGMRVPAAFLPDTEPTSSSD